MIKSVEPNPQLSDSVKKVLSILESMVIVPRGTQPKQQNLGETVAIDPSLVSKLVEVSELAAEQLKKPVAPAQDPSLQIENSRLQSALESKDTEGKQLKKNLDELKNMLAKSTTEDPSALHASRIKALEAEVASREETTEQMAKKLADLAAAVEKKDLEILSLRQDARNKAATPAPTPTQGSEAPKELVPDKYATKDMEDLIKTYLEKGYLPVQPAPRMIVPVEIEQVNAIIKGSKKLNAALEATQPEITQLKADLQKAEQKEKNTQDQLQRSQSAQKQLQNEVNLLEAKLEALEKANRSSITDPAAEAKIKALENEIASRKAEQARLASELEGIRNLFNIANAEVERLRAQQDSSPTKSVNAPAAQAQMGIDPFLTGKISDAIKLLVSKGLVTQPDPNQSSLPVSIESEPARIVVNQVPQLVQKLAEQAEQMKDLEHAKRLMQQKCEALEQSSQTEIANQKQKIKALADENEALRKNLQSLMLPAGGEGQDPRVKILESQLVTKSKELDAAKEDLADLQSQKQKDTRTIEDLRKQLMDLLEKKPGEKTLAGRDPALETEIKAYIRKHDTGIPPLPIMTPTESVELDKHTMAKLLDTANRVAADNLSKDEEISNLKHRLQQSLTPNSGSAEVDVLRVKVDQLTGQVDALTKQLNDERALRDQAERKNTSLTEELGTVSSIIPKIHAENETLVKDVTKLEKLNKELQDKAAVADAKLIAAEQEIASLKRGAPSVSTGPLPTQSSISPAQLEALEKELSKAVQKHPGLQQTVEIVPGKVQSGDIRPAIQSVAELSALLDQFAKQNQELAQDLSGAKTKLVDSTTVFDKEKESLKNEISRLQKEVDRLNKEIFDLKVDATEAKSPRTTAASLAPLQREVINLKGQIEQLEKDLKDSKDQAAKTDAALIGKNEEIMKLRLEKSSPATSQVQGPPRDQELLDLLSRADKLLSQAEPTSPEDKDASVPKDKTIRTIRGLMTQLNQQKLQAEEKGQENNDLKSKLQNAEAQATKTAEVHKAKLAEKDEDMKKVKNEKNQQDIAIAKLNAELSEAKEKANGNQLSNRGQAEEIEGLKSREGQLTKEVARLKDVNLQQELQILKLEQDKSLKDPRKDAYTNLEDIDPKLLAEAQRLLSQVFSKRLAEPTPSNQVQHPVGNPMCRDLVNAVASLLQALERTTELAKKLEEDKLVLQSKIQELEQRARSDEQKSFFFRLLEARIF